MPKTLNVTSGSAYIRIEGERGKFFFPITSMIIVSVVLTLLFDLFRR